MKNYITHADLYTPDEHLPDATLVIEDGKIAQITAQSVATLPHAAHTVNAAGMIVAPGMVDVHFHGALGMDTMDADPQSLHRLARWCLEHGVTSFYPTTWSASSKDILQALQAVAAVQADQRITWNSRAEGGLPGIGAQNPNGHIPGAHILGAHLEGPYIDLKYRGAQLPETIRTPDPVEYLRWFETGVVRLVTCAPEIDNGFDFIRAAVLNNAVVAIGHSQATCEQVNRAADLGATQATHIFNGMLGLHHREPGTVGAILTDERIYAQMICDGVHLHSAVVQLVLNAKTPERTILITDSVRGAGLADGEYEHKGQRFSVVDGVARTPDGGLSGSTLTLDQALRNAWQFTQRPLQQLFATVSSVPAAAMGLAGKKGAIRPGADADLVFFNSELVVQAVWLMGEPVFES